MCDLSGFFTIPRKTFADCPDFEELLLEPMGNVSSQTKTARAPAWLVQVGGGVAS